jgi:hypothetical protein
VETIRPNSKVMTLHDERGQCKTRDVFPGLNLLMICFLPCQTRS